MLRLSRSIQEVPAPVPVLPCLLALTEPVLPPCATVVLYLLASMPPASQLLFSVLYILSLEAAALLAR